MIVIVAGSRGITDTAMVLSLIALSGWEITEVISGDAWRGVDHCVLMKPWACAVAKMPANWKAFGKAAGFRRNIEMAEVADALIAIWDGQSHGTEHMISCMRLRGKPYCVFAPLGYQWS